EGEVIVFLSSNGGGDAGIHAAGNKADCQAAQAWTYAVRLISLIIVSSHVAQFLMPKLTTCTTLRARPDPIYICASATAGADSFRSPRSSSPVLSNRAAPRPARSRSHERAVPGCALLSLRGQSPN